MFSKATLNDLVGLLKETHSHTDLDSFGFRFDIEDHITGDSKQSRVTCLARYLYNHPDKMGILGGKLNYEIADYIIKIATNNEHHYNNERKEFNNYRDLKRLLLLDGFTISENELVRSVNTVEENETSRDYIIELLEKYDFNIALGHYNQAIHGYNRGDWASCNAQLRTYMEQIFIVLSNSLYGLNLTDSYQSRLRLANSSTPLIYAGLNEWLNNGKGYFETFFKRLHPEGSHPGLSDEDDSLFRIKIVQLSSLELLKRFDKINIE